MSDEQIGRVLERNREYKKKRQGFGRKILKGDESFIGTVTTKMKEGSTEPLLASESQGYRVKGTGDAKGASKVAVKAVDNRSRQNIVYRTEGTAPCITASEAKGPSKVATEARAVMSPNFGKKTCNGRTIKDEDDPSFALTCVDRHGVAISPADSKKGVMYLDGVAYNVRRLTPKECFRLQGFPDELFEKAAAVCSDTQLYRQAGNAVTATVSYEIGEWIMEMEGENGNEM